MRGEERWTEQKKERKRKEESEEEKKRKEERVRDSSSNSARHGPPDVTGTWLQYCGNDGQPGAGSPTRQVPPLPPLAGVPSALFTHVSLASQT